MKMIIIIKKEFNKINKWKMTWKISKKFRVRKRLQNYRKSSIA